MFVTHSREVITTWTFSGYIGILNVRWLLFSRSEQKSPLVSPQFGLLEFFSATNGMAEFDISLRLYLYITYCTFYHIMNILDDFF